MEKMILSYINMSLCFFFTICFGALRNRPNGVCGIRVSYTLDYPHIWRKTHIASSLSGIPCCLADLWCLQTLSPDAFLIVTILCLAFPLVVGCVVAAILGNRQIRQDAEQEDQQRREAEREESL